MLLHEALPQQGAVAELVPSQIGVWTRFFLIIAMMWAQPRMQRPRDTRSGWTTCKQLDGLSRACGLRQQAQMRKGHGELETSRPKGASWWLLEPGTSRPRRTARSPTTSTGSGKKHGGNNGVRTTKYEG